MVGLQYSGAANDAPALSMKHGAAKAALQSIPLVVIVPVQQLAC